MGIWNRGYLVIKNIGFGDRFTDVYIFIAHPCHTYNLSISLKLTKPQFPHLSIWEYLLLLVAMRLNEIICVK